jgi:hypothetical protein
MEDHFGRGRSGGKEYLCPTLVCSPQSNISSMIKRLVDLLLIEVLLLLIQHNKTKPREREEDSSTCPDDQSRLRE